MFTKEIYKVTLSNNDDKRLQTFDSITSYPYGTSVRIACRTELLDYLNIND